MDSLSIVIPAFNEAGRLPNTLDRILEWLSAQRFKFQEIIVVDDGSRDATAGVVDEYSKPPSPVRLLRNPGNRGKGYAVRHGMLDAEGEWILYTDADLSTPIEELQKLQAGAAAQDAVVAIGSRAVNRSLVAVHQSPFREYSGRFFNIVMRALTGLPFRDTQCGFKLYRADAAKAIFSRQEQDGFSFDVEDLVIAKKLGLRAIEVPVRWANVEGTKVTLAQGLKSFTDLLQIRKDHRS
ncbi:MAG TPA: dolichyl-phosphate beta-glucosyltransferase [Bryobacteraceae bacterium]|nr:dolichyl-phosphate beta-glucosyltransferase [Bryobacteraceae bacterium]